MRYLLPVFAVTLAGCTTLPRGAQIETVAFSEADKTLTGDLYLPASEQKTPLVIVVHGGGWARRTGDMTRICKKLAQKGFAAFNITYRLAPEHKYPKALDDVKEAIQWVKNNGRRYNIDTERIGGWGYSAGGHLILLAGLDPKLGLKAIVSGGTPAELTEWPKSPMITKFIGHPMDSHEEIWRQASPTNRVQEDSPPVFLYHGAWDSLVDIKQMELMEKALKEKNVEVQTHRVSLMGHFAVYLFSGESELKGLKFLKDRL